MLVEGPIETKSGAPVGTAPEGSAGERLLKEYDYVEEEYFVSGTANVYGPTSFDPVEPGQRFEVVRKPLSTVHEPDVSYTTRVQVVRPRDATRFSGLAHVVPQHVIHPVSTIDPTLMRRGHAWVGVEVNDGARWGTEARPSGGVAHLRRTDPERYRSLSLNGGNPEAWGLSDEIVGTAWQNMSIHGNTPEQLILSREMFRTLAQGPDILLDVAKGLKLGTSSVLPGLGVRRVYTSGASGSSLVPGSLVNDGHHDRNMLDDGRPPIDGYFIFVGLAVGTVRRPDGAVLAGFLSENEVLQRVGPNYAEDPPANTDDPRFRYYEMPGTGHIYSPRSSELAVRRGIDDVLPASGAISQKAPPGEWEYTDRVTAPMVTALWEAMYRWVEEGVPMPEADPVVRSADTPDGVARDEHGNASGGLRTPWVDVPTASYRAQISPDDQNFAGMKRFSDEKMQELYGSREEYVRRVDERLDDLIDRRLLLPEDRDQMVP